MIIKKKYRLIWFQHFHKAAGTSIVDLAEANNERLWLNHQNGNPIDSRGNQIELWKYSEDELRRFINLCEKESITFIATEWGLPCLRVLSEDHRVKLITCLRDPLDRFVSNFYFDLYYGFTLARKLEDYVATRGRSFTMFNYYCRVLSGHNNSPHDVNDAIFARAKDALSKFDICIILQEGFIALVKGLGWKVNQLQSNSLNFSFRHALSLIARGEMRLLLYRLLYPRNKPEDGFVKYFKSGNLWDQNLYNVIKANSDLRL